MRCTQQPRRRSSRNINKKTINTEESLSLIHDQYSFDENVHVPSNNNEEEEETKKSNNCLDSLLRTSSSSSLSIPKVSKRFSLSNTDSSQPPLPPPILYQLAFEQNYKQVAMRCQSHPEEVSYITPSRGNTALHVICGWGGARGTPNCSAATTTSSSETKVDDDGIFYRRRRSSSSSITCCSKWMHPRMMNDDDCSNNNGSPLEAILALVETDPMSVFQRNVSGGYTPLHMMAWWGLSGHAGSFLMNDDDNDDGGGGGGEKGGEICHDTVLAMDFLCYAAEAVLLKHRRASINMNNGMNVNVNGDDDDDEFWMFSNRPQQRASKSHKRNIFWLVNQISKKIKKKKKKMMMKGWWWRRTKKDYDDTNTLTSATTHIFVNDFAYPRTTRTATKTSSQEAEQEEKEEEEEEQSQVQSLPVVEQEQDMNILPPSPSIPSPSSPSPLNNTPLPHLTDRYSRRPLHLAILSPVASHPPAIIQTLLRHDPTPGNSVLAEDDMGRTPLALFCAKYREEIENILIEVGGDDHHGRKDLLAIMEREEEEILSVEVMEEVDDWATFEQDEEIEGGDLANFTTSENDVVGHIENAQEQQHHVRDEQSEQVQENPRVISDPNSSTGNHAQRSDADNNRAITTTATVPQAPLEQQQQQKQVGSCPYLNSIWVKAELLSLAAHYYYHDGNTHSNNCPPFSRIPNPTTTNTTPPLRSGGEFVLHAMTSLYVSGHLPSRNLWRLALLLQLSPMDGQIETMTNQFVDDKDGNWVVHCALEGLKKQVTTSPKSCHDDDDDVSVQRSASAHHRCLGVLRMLLNICPSLAMRANRNGELPLSMAIRTIYSDNDDHDEDSSPPFFSPTEEKRLMIDTLISAYPGAMENIEGMNDALYPFILSHYGGFDSSSSFKSGRKMKKLFFEEEEDNDVVSTATDTSSSDDPDCWWEEQPPPPSQQQQQSNEGIRKRILKEKKESRKRVTLVYRILRDVPKLVCL